MTTRTISLKVLTQAQSIKIETDARTFGEFKNLSEVRTLGIDWKSAKLIDRATKATFEIDTAVLPNVDSIMFVTPTKTKSGAYAYREAVQWVKEYKENGGTVNFNYTHATTSKLNEFIAATQALLAAQQAVAEVSEFDEENDGVIPVYELAEYITVDQLEEEAQELKKHFN